MDTKDTAHSGFAGKVAGLFIDSKLTPLAIIGSLLLGILAVVMLPREEEPQIKVPMIDVSFVRIPVVSPCENRRSIRAA